VHILGSVLLVDVGAIETKKFDDRRSTGMHEQRRVSEKP
jgi:hypothetical protein